MKSNWVSTRSDSEFEVLFRLYGPDPSFFEKWWRLPDIKSDDGEAISVDGIF